MEPEVYDMDVKIDKIKSEKELVNIVSKKGESPIRSK